MEEIDLAGPLAFNGVILILFSLLGYPPLQRCWGTLQLCKAGLLLAAVVCLLLPVPSTALAAGAPSVAGAVLYVVMFLKAFASCSAFTGAIILVNATPSPAQLGAVNGAGQTLASLVRGVGPAVGGVMWAAALQLQLPGQQYMPFVVISCITVGAWLLYCFVKPLDALKASAAAAAME